MGNIIAWLTQNGAGAAEALLAITGALASLFHMFHDDGASALFTGAGNAIAGALSTIKKLTGGGN